MNSPSHKGGGAEAAYRAELGAYLAHGGDGALERAARFGAEALAHGLTPGQVLGLHQRALESMPPAGNGRDAQMAGEFLAAALSAFDRMQSSARDSLIAWRHINDSLEKEVRRIAHALHDESGQLLVTLHLHLAQLSRDVPAARAKVQDCQQVLNQAEQQLRHLSHELRPMVLDDLGWLAAIEFLAHAMSLRARIPIEVRSSVTQRLAPAVETALYRVVQEALGNATRHAEASRIRVEIDQEQDCLYGSISDDGVGFEVEQHASNGGGLGLKGMHERLGALGGSLRVVSAPGRGAEIRFRLPLGN
jgi:signal transduction histidine kinase